MDISHSTSVAAAVGSAANSTPGTVGNAAGLLVLRKALEAQAVGAAQLLAALPQAPAPALATAGPLGRHINTYA